MKIAIKVLREIKVVGEIPFQFIYSILRK